MKNDSFKSIAVLTSICLIVALLLSSVNLFTTDIIKAAEAEKENEAFLAVLPDADALTAVELPADTPDSITAAMKAENGSGYAFKMVIYGYSGNPMNAIVGIGADGKIIKLSFIDYTDSPGIGSPEGFDALFRGKDNTTPDNDAGATVTTNAIKASLNDAYAVLAKVGSVEQSDEQKLALLWGKLMPAAETPAGTFSFSKLELPEGTDASITAAFAPSNEIGYVYLAKQGEKSVAVSVNAFGAAFAVYDLDGNDLSSSTEYDELKKKCEALLPPVNTAKTKLVTRSIKNALKPKLGEDAVSSLNFEAIPLTDISSSVAAAYVVRDNSKKYYAFIANTIGYGGVIKVLYILEPDGTILLYKATSHSESDGYGAAISDEKYAEKINGNSIDSLSDSSVLVSGATVTSNAVKKAKEDIKSAYTEVSSMGRF